MIFPVQAGCFPKSEYVKRTYYRNNPKDQLFRNQNKYFALRILSRSRHTNFVLIYFFVNKYVYCFLNIPDIRRLITSKVCFGSEKAGFLENSYDKCALINFNRGHVCGKNWKYTGIKSYEL